MNKDTYKIYSKSKEYEIWPIEENTFLNILYGKDDASDNKEVFIEESNGIIQGYISVKQKYSVRGNIGSIEFIFVDSKYRDMGIGNRLIKRSMEWFVKKGVKEIRFGGGCGTYFWPGIPHNLPTLRDFFLKNGFSVEDKGCVDMYGDITNFVPPKGVYDTLEENGLVIEFLTKEWEERVLQFTKENFPNWYEFYKRDIGLGEKCTYKIFFCHDSKDVVGISELWKDGCKWGSLFENNVGGGAALGVSNKWRGKGIGLGMKSWGTEYLRNNGIKYVYIEWTYAIHFYEKLGFKVWRKYYDCKLIQ